MAGYLGAALAGVVILLSLVPRARIGCGARLPAVSAVPASRWLSDAIADVPCAGDRVSYDTRDDLGAPVDALDPIDDPDGGYLGVYQSQLGSGRRASFMVGLGRSRDLVHWTRARVLIARAASMPTLRAVPGGPGYLLAYERAHGGGLGDTVALRFYPSRTALLAGRAGAELDLPLTLSRYNDGTPSFLAIRWRGGLRRSVIELGFHYETAAAGGGPGVDREAIGIIWGFRRFSAAPDAATDAAIAARGFRGSHGDRRQFSFGGETWRVYEAQAVPADFGTWHVLLTRVGAGAGVRGRFEPLSIGVAGGPYAASFGNPIVSLLRAPSGRGEVLAVTIFVFGSGPASAHAGELVYDQPL